jgi:O-antigen/teichoic acid export membrane protein
MIAEAKTTVRNAGGLLIQRGIDAAGALLFAIWVPRLMGPAIYGQYALITSLSIWFVLLSELGFTPVIGRYTPSFAQEGGSQALQDFFGQLLAVRLASAILAAALYLLLTRLWLEELDPAVLLIMAAALGVRSVAKLLFAMFMGLNQAARWGTREMARRWFSLALLLPGFYLAGLRGAVTGILLAELVALGIGFYWARSYLSWSGLDLDLRHLLPYVEFGLIFFGSDLLLSAFRRSGEALVQIVTGDYVQVGYFGLAYNVFLTAALVVPRLALSFAPLLTTLRSAGREGALQAWIERLLKWIAAGGVLIVFSALFLGEDLIPMVLGAEYRAIARDMVPLALTLLTLSLSSVARVVVLVQDRPGAALAAAAVRLGAFWAMGPPLVRWRGSLGACLAILGASVLYSAYFTWRARRATRYALSGWLATIGTGMVFLPLIWLRAGWWVNIALFAGASAGYCGLLFLLRVITPDEIETAWRAISN